ncbi:hypothetical protein D3C85_1521370 [compost metagenome]
MHAQRLRPGRGAAEPQLETQLDVFPGFFLAAGKGVDDAGAFELDAFERGNHRGMTAPYMDQCWKIEVRRQL